MTILQVALDLVDLFKAVDIAVKIAEKTMCRNIWIEAGTPLIKKWGTLSVEALKKTSRCFTVADTKTMDTGRLEAEIMYSAGADAVTVLGLADESTILEMIEYARENNKVLIADLINHPKPYEKALELDDLGVDVILYHVGIDVQRKRGITAVELFKEVEKLADKLNRSKIAVAGGIKHEDIEKLPRNIDIIIVGGAITKSKDPVDSTLRFLQLLENR